MTLKDLTLPEGFEIQTDHPLTPAFLEFINNDKLDTKGRANAALGLYAKLVESISEGNVKTWVELQDTWQNQLRQQHGPQLDAKLGKVAALINRYHAEMVAKQAPGTDPGKWGDQVRAAATETGAGNNPHWMNFIFWAADQLGEGAPLSGGPAGGERSREERMFGRP